MNKRLIIAIILVIFILYAFNMYIQLGMTNMDNIHRGDQCCLTTDYRCPNPISCYYFPRSWLLDQYKFDKFNYTYYMAGGR